MIKIFHNPRCRKSREALKLIQDRGEVNIYEYLKMPLDFNELKSVIALTGMKPSQFIRKNELIFKEKYKGKTLTEDEWIQVFVKEPKLLERPIVIKDNKAILGRPPENVLTLFG